MRALTVLALRSMSREKKWIYRRWRGAVARLAQEAQDVAELVAAHERAPAAVLLFMLKAVFFDFDGTLADDGVTIDQALKAACGVICQRWPALGAAALESTYRQVSDRAWGDYDRYLRPLGSAEAMLASLWRQTLERFGRYDEGVAHAAATTYWQRRLHRCQPYPDVLPFLADLTQRFHVSLLTNGAPSMQRAKVHASGLQAYFRDIFVGGEFDQGKPAPFIFSAALNAANCRPEEAVYIGDSLLHDVVGARKSGLHSVWLNRKRQPRHEVIQAYTEGVQGEALDQLAQPDFEITQLSALPACLDQL